MKNSMKKSLKIGLIGLAVVATSVGFMPGCAFTIGDFIGTDKSTKDTNKVIDSTPYTITFESRGGSTVSSHTQPANEILSIYNKESLKPTKSGYAFRAWYKDEGLTQQFTQVNLTGNVKLYAGYNMALERFKGMFDIVSTNADISGNPLNPTGYTVKAIISAKNSLSIIDESAGLFPEKTTNEVAVVLKFKVKIRAGIAQKETTVEHDVTVNLTKNNGFIDYTGTDLGGKNVTATGNLTSETYVSHTVEVVSVTGNIELG